MELDIHCPNCEWIPDNKKYWNCSCGETLNPFKLGTSNCPKCEKKWKNTICPIAVGGCNTTSLHLDWYHNNAQYINYHLEKILSKFETE